MKRIWKHVGVTLATGLLTSALGAACADNNPTIYVQQVLAPPQPSDGTCLYTDDPTSPILNTGNIDVAFADLSTYTPTFLIGNQILPQANATTIQVETSYVIVTGAITRITDLQGNDIVGMLAALCVTDPVACVTGKQIVGKSPTLPTPVNPFSTAETTPLPPASGGTAAYGAMDTTIIDADTLEVLRGYYTNLYTSSNSIVPLFGTSFQLLTYTKIVGTTLGGDAEESPEFEFPVTISFGNLAANLNFTSTTQVCALQPSSASSSLSCVPGQETASQLETYSQEIPECAPEGGAPQSSTNDGGF